MKKSRRRFDREFKIGIVAELESGKPLAQISREHDIHPNLPTRWRIELAENPEKAFSGNGNRYKDQVRIAELERLLGQAHAENGDRFKYCNFNYLSTIRELVQNESVDQIR